MYSIYKKNGYWCIKKDPKGKYKSLGEVNRAVKGMK